MISFSSRRAASSDWMFWLVQSERAQELPSLLLRSDELRPGGLFLLPVHLVSSVAQREYPRAPAPLVDAHESSTLEVTGVLRKSFGHEGTQMLRCNVA